jgi:hypothetical protein
VLAFALLLVVVMAWEYAPSMRGGFVYEDYKTTDACAENRLVGRMVTLGSWCWQTDLGHSPWAFRAVNLGLHFIVTALVGWLAWDVTRRESAALIAAAFVGVNAVNVESVAYLTSRGELIAALGVVGACLAAWHRWWFAAAALLWLGWMGKESAGVAVMLLPLLMWYQRRRALWLWATAAGAAVLAVGIALQTAAWWKDFPLLTGGAWALTQATAIARVVTLSVLPFGQTVDYDYVRVPLALQVWAAVSLVAGLAWAVRQSRLVALGAAWVACAVAPRLIVPTPQSVFNEHQFYVPLVGMSLILAGWLSKESAVECVS